MRPASVTGSLLMSSLCGHARLICLAFQHYELRELNGIIAETLWCERQIRFLSYVSNLVCSGLN